VIGVCPGPVEYILTLGVGLFITGHSRERNCIGLVGSDDKMAWLPAGIPADTTTDLEGIQEAVCQEGIATGYECVPVRFRYFTDRLMDGYMHSGIPDQLRNL
jgi:hypothetical protein